ncbi:MAG TPA: phytoene/squalene synthase family protein [Solirubrobacteraceae bacterium]|nr:phytoene/squalene synthase family protein [Solirubrobacteraceae bacterium]
MGARSRPLHVDRAGSPFPADESLLRASYALCRRMQRRHDPTFYWATTRLPADVRPAVHALYGFVRGADEIVDGARRPATADARRRSLDRWQGELKLGLERGHSDHPVIAAIVDAGLRWRLPMRELDTYMDSMRVDCGPVRLSTRADLDSYMRGSAGAVGLLMAPLLAAPADLHDCVASLGVAFQLTNFIRDVREDYALDRVYLPAEDRQRFGVSERDIATRRVTPGFKALVAREVERARELFAATARLPEALAPGVRPGVHLARAIYLGLLDHIEALDFDVLGRRAALPPWRIAPLALRSLAGGAR